MQFGGYIGVIRRWWFTLLAAATVGAVAGWLVAGALPPVFRSETRLLVGPVNADFDTLRASAELTRTYAAIASSSEILSSAIGSGGLSLTVEALGDAVLSTPNEQARIVTIGAELPNATDAARAVEAVAQALIAYTSAGAQRPEGELRVIDRASAAVSGTAQRTALIVVLAGLGALLGAMLLVLLIEALDSTLRDPEQVRRLAAATFIGSVPLPPRRTRTDAAAGEDPRHLELLGGLLGSGKRPPKSLLVLATDLAGDANDMTAALTAHLAGLGIRAAVIGGGGDEGQEARPDAPVAPLGAEVHDVQAATDLRDEVLRGADLVIVNGGSAKGSFTMPLWARAVDRVVLVARVGVAHRDTLLSALNRLAGVPGASVAVVAATGRVRRGQERARGGGRNPAADVVEPERPEVPEPEPVLPLGPPPGRQPSTPRAERKAATVRAGAGPRTRRPDAPADPTRRSMT